MEHKYVFVVLLAILLYMIYNYPLTNNLSSALLITCAGAMMVFAWKLYNSNKAENMNDKDNIDMNKSRILPQAKSSVPADDNVSFGSVYGNVNRDFNVDYVGQDDLRRMNIGNLDSIDNSDVFDDVFNETATHMPEESSSQNFFNVQDRAWFSKHFQEPQNMITYADHSTSRNDGAINADDMLTRRQIHRGDMNKKAVDGAVRSTRDNFERFYTHELAESEGRIWWEDENENDIMGASERIW